MVRITGNDGNTIFYSCECGTIGKCMVKPVGLNAVNVVDVWCPICYAVERVVLIQYVSEDDKQRMIDNLNEEELSWSIIISNEIVERRIDG